ncbi:hypothetical protein CHLRE_08g374650v5 [Chlamydomonas reinhardtii]|uniref:Tetratricopeptide repeat protein 29 n=1 Tax=Chlamydomonas reinhardtii TaxID=3055 RepID=A9ZPM1_CHLRE|nr:uncharacterized protein CHLRE_08g374650v5 [Chlamydomonas reinhardtii]PNW80023.1 hypothetical protein CHLRE_08g374650v5 [Chlamydomonas reinhardtii]8GLV_Lf Chain Lf, Subunit of axonemal inner dynein [Chlamydomonas reinhardtii]BAF98914.2 subunit of axonemal inner dynein [Chlamydomonas reinhardtii]
MATLVQAPMDSARGQLSSRENGGSREGKRTFKEKLHNLIAEAEAAEAQAYRETQLADKKSLCIQLLVEGRPQAFVDFFSLTHNRMAGGEVGPDGQPAAAAAAAGDDVPQEALGLLRSELLKADNALRTGDTQAVYASYKNLAKYFAQIGRLHKAEFFFRRCLRLSQDTQWLAGELEANLALGVVYEELQETEAAIACYERRLSLASDNQLALESDTAYQNLTTVYLRQAEVQESTGQVDDAIASYNKCLSAAERSGDNATAAKANYRIGMLYAGGRRHPEAVHYLRAFIDLAPHMEDKAAVGSAYTAFSGCLRDMGDTEAAVRCLEEYLQAARGGDPNGTALASCSLGIMLYEQGDLDSAVSYFEKFFETARTLNDRKMLDTARVNLGVARGALRMGAWMGVVANNLPKLIAWKGSRVPFTDH